MTRRAATPEVEASFFSAPPAKAAEAPPCGCGLHMGSTIESLFEELGELEEVRERAEKLGEERASKKPRLKPRHAEKEPASGVMNRLDFDGLGGVEVKPRDKKRKPNCKRALADARADARERVARTVAKDPEAWRGATPGTLVGLFAEMHLKVYGVEDAALESEYAMARSSALRLSNDLGGGNAGVREAAELVRWAMSRTRRINARNGGPGDFRVTWRFLFSRRTLTDYRVANPPSRRVA